MTTVVAAPAPSSTSATASPVRLLTFLEQVIGDCTVLRSRCLPGRGDVLETVDRTGVRWFAKRLENPGQWWAEVRTYRRWVPALGDRAPLLRAADEQLRALVVSAVPGRHGRRFDPPLHHGAGGLLRLFHDSCPPR